MGHAGVKNTSCGALSCEKLRKMGRENSLINDILKKIILALLEPFFYFIIIIILFLSGKKITFTVSFFLLYCI